MQGKITLYRNPDAEGEQLEAKLRELANLLDLNLEVIVNNPEERFDRQRCFGYHLPAVYIHVQDSWVGQAALRQFLPPE